jgi:hypothetical protein
MKFVITRHLSTFSSNVFLTLKIMNFENFISTKSYSFLFAHPIINSFTNISSLVNLLIEIININSLIYLIMH